MQFKTTNYSQINYRSKRTWTQQEQNKFKYLYKLYRKDFKQYVPFFDCRTEGQIKSFYQNVVHNNKQIQQSRTKPEYINQDVRDIKSLYFDVSQNNNDEFESTLLTFDNLDKQQ
ncbi:SANT/Myb_domain [Hexamita inflata]|uniref:SANT/Myb domain n=1 Tax=Hexamita inflata TaxID=28002 RepID=A0AA86NIM9_9EUKA|nr:SANT/Myb domain [Hexamita inflata]